MFRKIGQFEISADGDLIVVRSSAHFNLETLREYIAAVSGLIARMPPRFGLLARFDAPPIVGPEVEDAMREISAQRARRGLAAVAFVCDSRDGLSIAHGQWHRVYQPVAVPFAMFDDDDGARAWLRAQLDKNAPVSSPTNG